MSELIKTKEYRAWTHAKGRCYNPKDPRFKIYGAVGIGMCEKWRLSFRAFLEDMGRAPTPKHTLERRNGKLGYSPENCLWATRREQANNVSTNIHIEFDGKQFTLSQLASHMGLNYKSFWHYLAIRKLPLEIALEKATKLNERRKRGQGRFYTADISEINRRIAIQRWKDGGKAAWNR